MNVVFRVDASILIGTGHVMRCMVLARALSERGCRVVFVCRPHRGHLMAVLEEAGFTVRALPAARQAIAEGYRGWLGTDAAADAQQTLAAVSDLQCVDLLIVDHYGIDAPWELQLTEHVGRILVIDDLADRPHACEYLLDQNLLPDDTERYTGHVPQHCTLLLGPRYVLLRPEFFELGRLPAAGRAGKLRRVLIFFGGSDPSGETVKVLEALSGRMSDDLRVDVVVGPTNPRAAVIAGMCAEQANIFFHQQIPYMARLMSDADLYIGAGGTVTWERSMLGLTGLVVACAQNQVEVAEYLQLLGCHHYLGEAGTVSTDRYRDQFFALLANPEKVECMAQCSATQMRPALAGMNWIDGLLLDISDHLMD